MGNGELITEYKTPGLYRTKAIFCNNFSFTAASLRYKFNIPPVIMAPNVPDLINKALLERLTF